mmetsp:Transcript_28825/g.85076  ORF Transcript_28825/g.85076 Transcript_28825/m.85076 type:complete len:229 (-) Transcript_28825:680-1366(-)
MLHLPPGPPVLALVLCETSEHPQAFNSNVGGRRGQEEGQELRSCLADGGHHVGRGSSEDFATPVVLSGSGRDRRSRKVPESVEGQEAQAPGEDVLGPLTKAGAAASFLVVVFLVVLIFTHVCLAPVFSFQPSSFIASSCPQCKRRAAEPPVSVRPPRQEEGPYPQQRPVPDVPRGVEGAVEQVGREEGLRVAVGRRRRRAVSGRGSGGRVRRGCGHRSSAAAPHFQHE